MASLTGFVRLKLKSINYKRELYLFILKSPFYIMNLFGSFSSITETFTSPITQITGGLIPKDLTNIITHNPLTNTV